MELFNFLKAQKQENNIGFSVICFVENDLYKTALNFRRHIRKNKYTNYEIIFCGNISQKTKNAFKNKKDCIFAESDNNIASAYMCGAAIATKEYYCFTRAYEMWSDNALWELANKGETADCIYTNEEIRKGKNSVQRLHKPDFSPDTLRSRDYIGALFACKAKTYKSVGGIDASYGSAALTDLRLRLMDGASFAHVDKIAVYYDEKNIQPINSEQAERALLAYLHKSDLNAKVEKIENTEDCFRIKYTVKPCLVSIIIQSHNHATELKICIDSILKYTQNDIEIIIVENGSTQAELFCLYEEYNKNDKIKLLQWDKPWSYAAINNFAVQYAKGEQLLLLNNDTEILNSEWIDELLMFSQRADVGAVGAKLLYPNGTIQHAGTITGICKAARHALAGHENSEGYMHRLQIAQDLTAVTAACLMIKKDVYLEIGGMDENLAVGNNDVDMCLTLRKKGYLNIFTPFCVLIHNESASRTNDGAVQHARGVREDEYLAQKWSRELSVNDPYYSSAFVDYNADFTEKPVV